MQTIDQPIIDKVNNIMQQDFEIPAEKLHSESRIIEDLGLDSLDAVDMLVHLEDQFNIRVDIDQFRSARTLGDIYQAAAELINKH